MRHRLGGRIDDHADHLAARPVHATRLGPHRELGLFGHSCLPPTAIAGIPPNNRKLTRPPRLRLTRTWISSPRGAARRRCPVPGQPGKNSSKILSAFLLTCEEAIEATRPVTE